MRRGDWERRTNSSQLEQALDEMHLEGNIERTTGRDNLNGTHNNNAAPDNSDEGHMMWQQLMTSSPIPQVSHDCGTNDYDNESAECNIYTTPKRTRSITILTDTDGSQRRDAIDRCSLIRRRRKQHKRKKFILHLSDPIIRNLQFDFDNIVTSNNVTSNNGINNDAAATRNKCMEKRCLELSGNGGKMTTTTIENVNGETCDEMTLLYEQVMMMKNERERFRSRWNFDIEYGPLPGPWQWEPISE